MTLDIITTNSVGPGVRFRRRLDDQDLQVAAGVLVASDDNSAISGGGSWHDVTVLGHVRGAIYGIVLGNDMAADGQNTVTVEAGGLVEAVFDAVRFKSAGALVTNRGELRADSDGVVIGGIGSGSSTVVNHGVIRAVDQGIEVNDGTTEVVVVENHGLISGDNDAYVGDVNADRIVNRGAIHGDIYLKEGDDLYDGRGGVLEAGTIYGGDGDDRFLPGDGAEAINGGSGHDILDFRAGPGLRVSLSDATGTGAAAGDSYRNIEQVLGSATEGDTLLGNGSANTLEGLGGQDTLRGSSGNDLLAGGAGADLLSGGSGNDAFEFAAPDEGGDVVLDFGSAAGNDDEIRIVAAGFGGGLAAGAALDPAAFVARTDNLAQDADDRFVFRTTDRTLWFDADGSGAEGAALLADLQSGATLTAADLVLV